MMILTRLLCFNYYFTKSLESAPISKANTILSKFIRQRVDRAKYEEGFSAYQSYLQRIISDNPTVDHHKLSLFDHVTRVYWLYRIPSKKLNRIHNEIAQQCLQITVKEGPEAIVSILGLIQRYNQKKAIAVFRTHKEAISKKLRSFPVPTIFMLVKFLKDAKIDDPIIRQTIIQILYKEMAYLSQVQLFILSNYLSLSRKYVNKDFLVSLAKRITQLYKSGNLQEKLLFAILSNITQIEVNLHTRSIYVDQLDKLYQVAFPSLFSTIHTLDDRSLNQLTSSLRRSKFFSETMLNQLVDAAMQREIHQLAEEQRAFNKGLSLATFVNITNTLAVFNFQVPEFKKYLMSILKLLALHKDDLLSAHHFSRLVWSLCVMFQRIQLKDAFPLIQRSLARAQVLPQHQAMNFYLCYLYLRTIFPQINDHRDKIHKFLQSSTLETHSSLAQRQAFHLLQDLGIPCLMEYNLNNMICDLMVPEWQNLRNTIIEFHGFRHFCRNVKRLTGSNILKQKIVTGEKYGYYFIAIDEWLIAQNKKEFLNNFMSHINSIQGNKNYNNSVVLTKTATRVRNRPRVFKVNP